VSHELSCLLHVHSTYSDRTATVPELLDAARGAGADVVILTDHDTMQAARDGWEGRHDGVLLIVGHEVSPRDGHLLAFDTGAEVPHRGHTESELCGEVARRGGFGIAAHPFSQGSRLSRRIGRPHPWGALSAPGCVGIELWSLATDVAEGWTSPAAAWRSLLHPERTVDGPPDRHLRLWDRLCAERRVVAVGGIDAHQPGLRIGGRVRSIMPHRRWFGMLRTQVLLDRAPCDDAGGDRAAVLAALRAGRCYLARVDLGATAGFSFHARARSGARAQMGEEVRTGDGWRLSVEVPAPATLRLLRGGHVVANCHGERLRHDADAPGAYRAEALVVAHGGPRRWIVTNPLYVRR
jgi:hypothetical protein